MKKKILSMILATAMVISLFAGITVMTSAAETLTDGKYVIAANVDGVYYAMPNAGLGSGKIAGEQITVTNGTVAEADAAAYALNVAVMENGNITISNDEGVYLGYASSTNFNGAEGYEWVPTVREDGAVVYVASGSESRIITYRTGTTNKFAPYSTSNYGKVEYYNVEFLTVAGEGECIHENAESTVTTPAGCTTPGEATWTCSCGATGTTVIPPTGHNVTEWNETIAPTCTAKGEKTGTCTNCDEAVTESVPAKGHEYGEPVVTAPTCTEAGYTTVICNVCGDEKKSDETPATGHTYAEGACTVCGEAQPESKSFKAVAADAIVAGNYILAVDRNGSSEYPVVYPATSEASGHWYVSDSTVTAVADVIDSATLPVDAAIFTLEGDSTNGFTVSYTNENGEVLYLGYSEYSKAKNAFAAEYNTFLWKVITNDKGNVGLQTGEGDTVYTISAGQTTAASALRGYVSGTVYNTIYFFKEVTGDEPQPCEHTNTSIIPAVEATCTTNGNTEGVKCDDCGAVLSGNETIPALGHDKSIAVVDGTVKTVCANCGETEELALNTIAEAKAYTDKTVVYNVKGIVTYVSGRNVYIQDEEAGLCVYFAYDFDTSGINRGDEIFVSATMTTYNGLIELNQPKEYFVLSSGHTVEAQIVDLPTLAADTTNEYLGEKVLVKGATITEIATNGSVTLEQNGTTMIIYKAPALTEDCVVGATVNVTAVVSSFKGYQLLVQEAADVVVVTEEPCAHSNITVLEAVAATCTETGLTEGAKCADCGEITVPQEVIPALGHANTTVSNGDGTHTTTCGNCGEATTGDCDYVDGICSVCGAKEPVSEPVELPNVGLNHTLNLASDISISYAVLQTVVAEYDRFYVEAVVPTYSGNEQTGSYTVTVEPTSVDMFYYFTLTGITAVQMNDVIEARLYMVKGDEVYMSRLDTYSVGTYAYSQLNKSTSSEELKALCADLLRYGSYAQIFKAYRTDALVNANMTEAMMAYLSDMEGVTFNNNKADLGDFENPSIKWMGRVLNLDSKVEVKFVFTVTDPTVNVEDLTAKITYVNYKGETVTVTVGNAELYNEAMGYYAFSFDSLLAAELRAVMNTVVYNGETRVSTTSTYSVDTYGNGKTGALLDVCKAMIAYSDTALAYFN